MNRTILSADDIARFEDKGIYLHGAKIVMDDTDPWKKHFNLAMDAQPALISVGNAGIPAYLTTVVDPALVRILTAKNKAAEILGEERKGSWTDQTAMFTVVEQTGEVAAYGDFNESGRAGLNTNFPQRQSFNYQLITEYGDLEADRAGLAKIGWAAELKEAAAAILNKFQNLTYFKGVANLQNYGLLNDPGLNAVMVPATKAATGTTWITALGVVNATANEVYADILSLYGKLVNQSSGNVDDSTPLIIAMSPLSSTALKITNSFGITVKDMLAATFPGLEVKTAMQYGAISTSNPQGLAGGELVQLIATTVEGQSTGTCAYNEKLRTFPIFRDLSSFKQKLMQGSWGAIIKAPFAIAQMQGV